MTEVHRLVFNMQVLPSAKRVGEAPGLGNWTSCWLGSDVQPSNMLILDLEQQCFKKNIEEGGWNKRKCPRECVASCWCSRRSQLAVWNPM